MLKQTQRYTLMRLLALALLAMLAFAQASAQTLKGFMTSAHRDSAMSQRDVEYLTGTIGAKILRYPIFYSPDMGSTDLDGYWVPRIWPILQICQARGATLIVEVHWPNDADSPKYGQGSIYDINVFVERWRILASRFQGQPNLWFGLANEPRSFHGPGLNVPWRTVAQDAANAIRSVDPNRMIVVPIPGSTTASASNFRPLDGPDGHPMRMQIVEAHFWNFSNERFPRMDLQGYARIDTSQQRYLKYPDASRGWTRDGMRDALKPLRDLREKYGTPILIGEVGVSTAAPYCAAFLQDFTQVATNYGFHTVIHAYNEASIWDYERYNTPTWNYLSWWVRT